MPFYEYKCSHCGYETEEFQKISDEPLTKCPKCKKNTFKRLIGGGAGIIFKGSGFYLTDYVRNKSEHKKDGHKHKQDKLSDSKSSSPKKDKTETSKSKPDKSDSGKSSSSK
jgi:putative FmdB family regulatory protein